MSRREEVENIITDSKHCNIFITANERDELARTLADEVDALRAKKAVYARRTQQYELTTRGRVRALEDEKAERDAVITKLLEMLDPGEKPTQIGGDMAIAADSALAGIYMTKRELYNRALEIAGRKDA